MQDRTKHRQPEEPEKRSKKKKNLSPYFAVAMVLEKASLKVPIYSSQLTKSHCVG